jgi:phospholipid/cholesterol/gamma-HCH transport system substrate-binding protein
MSIFNRKSGRTSFLERNQLIIGIVGALLFVGGSAFSLLLGSGVFNQAYKVTAYFSDAAGIKSGDNVKVAGLEAGKIGSIEISDGLVAVELKVDKGIELSKDATAEITIETLLGRKSVTLFDGSAGAPLADGDEIAIEDTITPIELVDLADTSVRLLEESDADALETFMAEVSKITSGKREQITTLIDGLGNTLAAVDERKVELASMIDSLRVVSTTFAERDDTLVHLIDNFDVVLANLAERTDELVTFLENTDEASHEVAALVARNRGHLDSAISGLSTTLRVLDKHQVDLAATISYLEKAVQGYSSVGYSQGVPNRWANIFVQSLGPAGVDAALGPCGALDQALDELLGPDPRDCDEREDFEPEGEDPPLPVPKDGDGGETTEGPGTGTGADEEEPGLGGDIGDILDSVTGNLGLGDALKGGL